MNLSNNGQSKITAQGGFAESESEIKKYLRILKRRKWLIIATLLLVSLGWTIFHRCLATLSESQRYERC
jgi:uncharacterized protein involved in exopolysaccharide biosynthesis